MVWHKQIKVEAGKNIFFFIKLKSTFRKLRKFSLREHVGSNFHISNYAATVCNLKQTHYY